MGGVGVGIVLKVALMMVEMDVVLAVMVSVVMGVMKVLGGGRWPIGGYGHSG